MPSYPGFQWLSRIDTGRKARVEHEKTGKNLSVQRAEAFVFIHCQDYTKTPLSTLNCLTLSWAVQAPNWESSHPCLVYLYRPLSPFDSETLPPIFTSLSNLAAPKTVVPYLPIFCLSGSQISRVNMKLNIAVVGALLLGFATASPNPRAALGGLEGWLAPPQYQKPMTAKSLQSAPSNARIAMMKLLARIILIIVAGNLDLCVNAPRGKTVAMIVPIPTD